MRSALFRVDGSQRIGLGHIMRCVAFSQGLEQRGVEATFVTRNYDNRVAEVVQSYGYGLEMIPQGCTLEEDCSLTLRFAEDNNAGIIVTDLCNIDVLANVDKYCRHLECLKSSGKFLITIDDLNQIPFPSEIVINPNYGAENTNYESNGSTRFLLGPAYFIFRREFIEAARANRQIKKDAQNILLAMGGSDSPNLTLKVARALTKMDVLAGLNLRIVLGIIYPDSVELELEEVLRNARANCEILQEIDNMAELMLWSDLTITGGGLTKYETAVTGTPSIIISQVEHQAELSERFRKEGTAIDLGLGGKVNEQDIVEAVNNLLDDYSARLEMSRKGREFIDGRGIEHVISEIPREVLM